LNNQTKHLAKRMIRR